MLTLSRVDPSQPKPLNRSCTLDLSFVPAETPKPSPAKPRVLVINDKSNVCELLLLYLEPRGLEVATVHRADEARTIIARGQFDLVVLDWELDGRQGLALLHLAKTQHPEIPVIIFTGDDLHDGVVEDGLAGEADAVVRGKGSLTALSATIFRHLESRDGEPLDRARAPMNYDRR
jgi:DNA-binding NtrC family response regulator